MTIVRVDTASLSIPSMQHAIYLAFAEPGAMERWLPPDNMTGKMLYFDFREGGSYRMRLTYTDATQTGGKTSEDADEVEVRLTRIEEDYLIEQEVVFQSDDPRYSGVMRMHWIFQPETNGTLVTIRAENVPSGIRPEDHVDGMKSSLAKLSGFVTGQM